MSEDDNATETMDLLEVDPETLASEFQALVLDLMSRYGYTMDVDYLEEMVQFFWGRVEKDDAQLPEEDRRVDSVLQRDQGGGAE